MTTSFLDNIPIRGDLTVIVRDAQTRSQLRRYDIRNKITFLMADVLLESLQQLTTATPPAQLLVHSMRMGSSSTPASRSDTNLGAYQTGVAMGNADKVTGIAGELQFSATLEAGDGNGVTFQEAGLFTAGPTPSVSDTPGTTVGTTRMVARQIHPPIPKTLAIVLEYQWRIAFTA